MGTDQGSQRRCCALPLERKKKKNPKPQRYNVYVQQNPAQVPQRQCSLTDALIEDVVIKRHQKILKMELHEKTLA